MAPTNFGVPESRRQARTLFLLGGYTNKSVLAHNPRGGEGDGLYSVMFDPDLGKIQPMQAMKVETNPAFIMKHPTLDLIYLTTEVINDSGSEVLTGALDRRSGQVSIIDRKQVNGKSTCHLEWDSDKSHIIAVSYWDSRLTTFPVKQDGSLGDASEVYKDPGAEYVDRNKPNREEHLRFRQRWSHLHQVNRDPFSDKIFMIPDLGNDQIRYFNINGGRVLHLGRDQLTRGGGPRHMDFNVKHRVVYVCGELNNTVTVLKYNPEKLSKVMEGGFEGDVHSGQSLLTQLQVVSTVPADIECKSTIAEMRLHPSGRFLYVGNRGHDSIAIFRVNDEDGSLSLVDMQSSLGAFPRHFNFDRTGQYIFVANHASDSLVSFRIMETGKLEATDRCSLPSIVWVTPVEPEE